MANGNNTEVEFKLALGPDGYQQLAHSSVLTGLPPTRMTLGNRYFDTHTGDLRAHGLALRLRKGEGDSIMQTLKSKGSSSGGLSQRGEWQWVRDHNALDLEVLQALGATQPELAVLTDTRVLERMAPLFETDFTRTAYLIEWQGARIELAIDQGSIKAAGLECAINEAELELKSGEPEVMWSLAQTLATEVVLRPSNASKASRANTLGQPTTIPTQLPETPGELLSLVIDGLDGQQDEQESNQGQALALTRRAAAALAFYCDRPEAQELAQLLATQEWYHNTRCGQLALALAHGLAS